MGDNLQLPDRNGVRTPMQWDSSPNAGFSTAERIFAPLIDSDAYGPHRVNVKDAQNEPSSFYNTLRHMIHLRRKHQAFGSGRLMWLDNFTVCRQHHQQNSDRIVDMCSSFCSSSCCGCGCGCCSSSFSGNSSSVVASWVRCFGLDVMLVVSNLSSQPQHCFIPLPRRLVLTNQSQVCDLLSGRCFLLRKASAAVDLTAEIARLHIDSSSIIVCVDLHPYEFLWIELSLVTPFATNLGIE